MPRAYNTVSNAFMANEQAPADPNIANVSHVLRPLGVPSVKRDFMEDDNNFFSSCFPPAKTPGKPGRPASTDTKPAASAKKPKWGKDKENQRLIDDAADAALEDDDVLVAGQPWCDNDKTKLFV